MITAWDRCWIEVARRISLESKDPNTKVGCVLTDSENFIVSTGINGCASGYDYDSPDERLSSTIHAEVNALLTANGDAHNAYIWPYFPCSQCMAVLTHKGIKRIISLREPHRDRWDWPASLRQANAKNVELVYYDKNT